MIIFANSLEPGQTQHCVGSDLDPKHLYVASQAIMFSREQIYNNGLIKVCGFTVWFVPFIEKGLDMFLRSSLFN